MTLQLKQISDGLLARAAHFGAGWSPEHAFGRKGEPKIMHRLSQRAERSGYWQACLVACLEWGLRWTVRYSTRHSRNDNPYMLSVGGRCPRSRALRAQ